MKKLMFIGLTAMVLISCAQKSNESALGDSTDATMLSAKQDPLAVTPLQDIYSDGKGKMIKNAEYRFQVNNVKKSQELIEVAVRKYSAYIASSNLELENPILTEHLTIRVLSDYFDDLLKAIDGQAVFVNYRKINTEDASKEFIDLESRLRTKREVEQRYTDILRHKAGTIEELLKAEQQIVELHEEIEATVSRINFLHDQVRYSTIQLEFYQVVEEQVAAVKAGPSLAEKFSQAFDAGMSGFMNILITLAYFWPLIILSGAAWYFFWFRRKRKILEAVAK
ncbi:MAG: DUF4349 domain-containing protein [Chryseolinea sp.]